MYVCVCLRQNHCRLCTCHWIFYSLPGPAFGKGFKASNAILVCLTEYCVPSLSLTLPPQTVIARCVTADTNCITIYFHVPAIDENNELALIFLFNSQLCSTEYVMFPFVLAHI